MLVDSPFVTLLGLFVAMRRPIVSHRAVFQKRLLAWVSDSALAIVG